MYLRTWIYQPFHLHDTNTWTECKTRAKVGSWNHQGIWSKLLTGRTSHQRVKYIDILNCIIPRRLGDMTTWRRRRRRRRRQGDTGQHDSHSGASGYQLRYRHLATTDWIDRVGRCTTVRHDRATGRKHDATGRHKSVWRLEQTCRRAVLSLRAVVQVPVLNLL